MDFELSEEHRAVRDLCREFAREVVAPAAEELDREARFPYDIVRQLGEMGMFGLPFAEEWGGAGADFLAYCLAIEEISRADAGVGITLEAAVSLGAAPIHDFGTQEQKAAWLPDLLAGRKLWAFGLTEPDAGSDAGATRTRAELSDGAWIINGSKQFITNSGTDISAGVTITAVTAGGAPRSEISAILVPAGTPGYQVLPPYRKLGWHSSDTHPLAFDDCRVPEENLLGRRGGGYQQFLRTLTGGRIAIAALSVGLAQACLDASVVYAKQRTAFGRAISQFQAIQFKLADMATEVELARLATYRAAAVYQAAGGRTSGEVQRLAAMAKLFSSETSKRAADQAVQIHGGYGFIEDYPVARYWRDVKVNEIGEGTSEVQRMLIAREILGGP
ncbi:MAG: acyl-CoA dehydrogenase family protein [Candidatus Dormibacteraeota bacterium]|nr:acyl-CoA dehydrogenase family protein [Candidatus Dormibacteraeota bacterium]